MWFVSEWVSQRQIDYASMKRWSSYKKDRIFVVDSALLSLLEKVQCSLLLSSPSSSVLPESLEVQLPPGDDLRSSSSESNAHIHHAL
jgi:hypothetical protein